MQNQQITPVKVFFEYASKSDYFFRLYYKAENKPDFLVLEYPLGYGDVSNIPESNAKEVESFTFRPASEYYEDLQTNLNKLSAINKDLNASLESFGFENVEVSINANIFASQLEIYWIEVDLTNAKYKDKTKDIAWLKMQINEIIDEFAILKNVEVRFDG